MMFIQSKVVHPSKAIKNLKSKGLEKSHTWTYFKISVMGSLWRKRPVKNRVGGTTAKTDGDVDGMDCQSTERGAPNSIWNARRRLQERGAGEKKHTIMLEPCDLRA
jgi:hypothetical protein